MQDGLGHVSDPMDDKRTRHYRQLVDPVVGKKDDVRSGLIYEGEEEYQCRYDEFVGKGDQNRDMQLAGMSKDERTIQEEQENADSMEDCEACVEQYDEHGSYKRIHEDYVGVQQSETAEEERKFQEVHDEFKSAADNQTGIEESEEYEWVRQDFVGEHKPTGKHDNESGFSSETIEVSLSPPIRPVAPYSSGIQADYREVIPVINYSVRPGQSAVEEGLVGVDERYRDVQ